MRADYAGIPGLNTRTANGSGVGFLLNPFFTAGFLAVS